MILKGDAIIARCRRAKVAADNRPVIIDDRIGAGTNAVAIGRFDQGAGVIGDRDQRTRDIVEIQSLSARRRAGHQTDHAARIRAGDNDATIDDGDRPA